MTAFRGSPCLVVYVVVVPQFAIGHYRPGASVASYKTRKSPRTNLVIANLTDGHHHVLWSKGPPRIRPFYDPMKDLQNPLRIDRDYQNATSLVTLLTSRLFVEVTPWQKRTLSSPKMFRVRSLVRGPNVWVTLLCIPISADPMAQLSHPFPPPFS